MTERSAQWEGRHRNIIGGEEESGYPAVGSIVQEWLPRQHKCTTTQMSHVIPQDTSHTSAQDISDTGTTDTGTEDKLEDMSRNDTQDADIEDTVLDADLTGGESPISEGADSCSCGALGQMSPDGLPGLVWRIVSSCLG